MASAAKPSTIEARGILHRASASARADFRSRALATLQRELTAALDHDAAIIEIESKAKALALAYVVTAKQHPQLLAAIGESAAVWVERRLDADFDALVADRWPPAATQHHQTADAWLASNASARVLQQWDREPREFLRAELKKVVRSAVGLARKELSVTDPDLVERKLQSPTKFPTLTLAETLFALKLGRSSVFDLAKKGKIIKTHKGNFDTASVLAHQARKKFTDRIKPTEF